jgi:Double zinc ribbon
MEEQATTSRECPYCREDIKAEAVKCKHCGFPVSPSRPSHGGTCPYCKEEIHAEAVRCKHCKSWLSEDSPEPGRCCGGGSQPQRLMMRTSRLGQVMGGGPLMHDPAKDIVIALPFGCEIICRKIAGEYDCWMVCY